MTKFIDEKTIMYTLRKVKLCLFFFTEGCELNDHPGALVERDANADAMSF